MAHESFDEDADIRDVGSPTMETLDDFPTNEPASYRKGRTDAIVVCSRFRPMNANEKGRGSDDCVQLHDDGQGVTVVQGVLTDRWKSGDVAEELRKTAASLEQNFPHTPSLLHCRSLLVHGPVECGPGVVFQGDAVIHNHTDNRVKLKAGIHEGQISVA